MLKVNIINDKGYVRSIEKYIPLEQVGMLRVGESVEIGWQMAQEEGVVEGRYRIIDKVYSLENGGVTIEVRQK